MNIFSLNNKGMSLMEIVVGMTLFSIGILSLGLVIPFSTKKLNQSRARTSSVTHAQRLMDQVAETGFDDVLTFDGQVLDPIPGSEHFKAEIDVDFCIDTGEITGAINTEYKKIRITITPKGGKESITMSTVISKKGV